MARFSEQFIQQVLQATDLIDLVGQYVALKHKGREFVGLCPFHEDQNPSLNVSPAKQIYKCFACGAGGNAAQFLMAYEKSSFPEAIRSLAQRANIPLPADYEPAPEGGLSKNDLVVVVEFAAGFFREQLHSPGGKVALDYARHRGLSDASIERFGLGYAPEGWETLLTAGRRKGFREEQMLAAGLIRRREEKSGCYDYFRHRLMFPIHDVTGRAVAFGGRALAADERAKYLNSPEGVLFDKSSLLFGLKLAREEIVRIHRAAIVEGYLDVLMPQQAGVTNVVATLGTALTDRHVRLLSRYAEEVVLVFDADVAGAAAAERALDLFLAQRLHVRVATIPTGKDPCDYVLAEGGPALQSLIDNAPDALEYVWDHRWRAFQAAGGNPAQRSRVIEDFLTRVVSCAAFGAIDGVRQQNLAQHIAHVVNVPAIDLQQQMRRLARQVRPNRTVPPPAQSSAAAGDNAERHVLEVLLDRPELFSAAAERIGPEDFRDALYQTIAQQIWALGLEDKLSLEDLLSREDLLSLGPTLTELSFNGQRRGNHEATLQDAVTRLLDRRDQQEYSQMKGNLDDAETLRQIHERLAKAGRLGDRRKRPGIQ
jgi:DNA primase